MRKITFDIETKNLFSDIGSHDPAGLDISVIGIHDSETGRYTCFLESELKHLWPIIEQADLLITWNGEHFDIPLLNKYYPGDISKIKNVDLMKEVYMSLGRRLKLDTVASATLGTGKMANGLEAIEWWKKGDMENLIKYCLDDVRITKELYEYALANKSVKYRDGNAIKNIALNTSLWEVPAMNALTFTLPF